MNISQKPENRKLTGYLSGLSSYTMWGFLPFFWKALDHVPPLQIMLNRIIWCFVFLLIISAFRKRNCFKLINSFRIFASVLITGLILSSNWFTYIFAVNTGKIIEASLGYYITPLVSIALGIIFFKERLNKLQITALVFAAGGVLYMTLDYGQFPFIALYLALSFGTYGCLKKLFSFDSIDGLMAETFSVVPVAVLIMIIIGFRGESSLFSGSLRTDILIMLSGVVTGVPLLFFAEAAKRIPLSAMGFLQYIAPTLMLLTGIFYYKEPFLRAHIVGFSLIWTGLLIYSYSVVKELRNNR